MTEVPVGALVDAKSYRSINIKALTVVTLTVRYDFASTSVPDITDWYLSSIHLYMTAMLSDFIKNIILYG